MKKLFLGLFVLSLATMLPADRLDVSPAGQINVGTQVVFRVPAGRAPDASYNWDFGDGSPAEVKPGMENRHVYNQPGSYHVTATPAPTAAVAPPADEATITVVDNRRISPQGGNFRQGKRVNFQSENFVSNSLRWDFGDGTVESGPRNNGHVYASPGNFTVRAYDNNGDTPLFSTCQVMIGADNRQLSASPNAPRANQAVAFSAQNFTGGLRWDYGDGTSENGGPAMRHSFRQPGTFQVRVWESPGTADDAISLALPVSPDNRLVQAAPPPRAGLAANFTASNFAGGDLKWSFGDGRTESGGPAITHVFPSPGNAQVLVWDAGEGQDSALRTTISVQPDPRQLVTSGPPDIFEGSEVVFEGRSFTAPGLKWDFGDGVVERGDARKAHRFQRPGSYLVKVVEADTGNLPLEKRVQVLKDNRSLALKSSLVFANGEFEIEAQNFRGPVSWDFGDGTVRTGTRLMKHRYARTGQFRVRAVDFSGREGKFIEKNILVENDTRVISLPGGVIAGEEVAMQLQNADGGSFTWKFSDGESRSGQETRGKAFRSVGPQKITVIDPTGKYPPLEKIIQVLPDTRSLKGSSGFILPKEEVSFTAVNFTGPGVRWNFGDGTVKENGQMTEKHVYGALGRYQATAVDFSGRSSKAFTFDVVVAEITPGFTLDTLEFAFDNGKYYRVIAKKSPSPGYQLRARAKGRGVLTGQFILDSMPIGLFQLVIQENQAAVLPKAQMAALPVIDLGLHELTVKFTNYTFNKRIPIIKYFVSEAGMIQIAAPPIDGKVPAGGKVGLRWSIEQKNPRFEIAISEMPFQFLNDKQIEWLPAGESPSYLFDPKPYRPGAWIYWQVRLLNESKQVQTTSEIASFKLGE